MQASTLTISKIRRTLYSLGLRRKKRKGYRPFQAVSVLRLAWLASIFGTFAGAAGVYFVVSTVASGLPSNLRQRFLQSPEEASLVYADDGTIIGKYHEGNRIVVPLDDIPVAVQNAFIAAEDGNFRRHPGFDLRGIIRAAYTNWKQGKTSQGGSTITQQVTKLLLLEEKFYRKKRDYSRKLDELIMAVRVERQLSKTEILAIYLNRVFLGNNAYGVAAAARTHFAKRIEDISIAEAAYLAALVNGPSQLSRDFAKAKARQLYVLGQMEELGFITSAQHQEAKDTPLVFFRAKPTNDILAPHFVEEIRRWAVLRYGNRRVLTGGLRFYSTLSIPHQRAAERAVKRGVEDVARRLGFSGPLRMVPEVTRDAWQKSLHVAFDSESAIGSTNKPLAGVVYEGMLEKDRRQWFIRLQSTRYPLTSADIILVRKWQQESGNKAETGHIIPVLLDDGEVRIFEKPTIDAALVSMRPETGQVMAMIGGYEASPLNLATQGRRQVGSSIKPFIYLSALEHGYTPTTKVTDAPIVMRFGDQVWSPKNYDGRYRGQVPLRYALAKSLNTVSVRLLSTVGLEQFTRLLRRVGITREVPQDLSIALGSVELTPMELATAYLAIASGGQALKPRLVDYVTDRQGNIIDDFRDPVPRMAIDPAYAYVITDMMAEVVRNGTARRAKVLPVPAAGKTGTTNDYRDAWFNGFTPHYLTSVWVGRRGSNTTIGKGATGGNTALPIWVDYNKAVHGPDERGQFEAPPGVWLIRQNGRLTPYVSGSVEPSLLPQKVTSARLWKHPWP